MISPTSPLPILLTSCPFLELACESPMAYIPFVMFSFLDDLGWKFVSICSNAQHHCAVKFLSAPVVLTRTLLDPVGATVVFLCISENTDIWSTLPVSNKMEPYCFHTFITYLWNSVTLSVQVSTNTSCKLTVTGVESACYFQSFVLYHFVENSTTIDICIPLNHYQISGNFPVLGP